MIVVLSLLLLGQKVSIKVLLNQSWDLLLFFLILTIGLIYSTDFKLGLRQLETSLSFIGVPVVVYGLGGFSKERMNSAFYAFALGALVAGLICIINAAVSFTKTGDYQVFFYNQFTQPVDSHPTYFAYYLIFIITFGLYFLYYDLPKQFFGSAVAALLFFFVLLLLTGGQTAFISLLLTFAFFISKYSLEEKTRRESLVVTLIATMLVSMVVVTIFFRNNEQFFSTGSQNDYWERMALWKSAIAANTSPLFGVGTGDYNLVLNEYYRGHQMNHFAEENFNSHNQLIQMYFSNGLVGLFSLLLVLGRPLYVSVTQRNLLGILLYFPFLMYGVNEVFLGRYQGVVFLALVHQILVSQHPDTSAAIEPLKVNKL
ncbi:MAG: O-antigen ligase family protein [Cytophagales bacterium]|jgi:O-antigen ligase|nr:O-antigen ligase family protein [Cytophagales bacterium]